MEVGGLNSEKQKTTEVEKHSQTIFKEFVGPSSYVGDNTYISDKNLLSRVKPRYSVHIARI